MLDKRRDRILQLIWCKEREYIQLKDEDAGCRVHVRWHQPRDYKSVAVLYSSRRQAEWAAMALAAKLVHVVTKAQYNQAVAEWFISQ